MVKQHLKRIAAPKAWNIQRKTNTFIARPYPGGHPLEEGMGLGTFLKEIFGYARNTKEAKQMLRSKDVLVDESRRKNVRLHVGLFDTISFPDIKEQYRIILSKHGKLDVVSIPKEEAAKKPCKITNKSKVKGKTQLNLFDGRNLLVDKDEYKTGDTIILELPSQKITNHHKLAKKALIFLIGGKHKGSTGVVQDIVGNKIMYKTEEGSIAETLKKYAFVLGEGKPSVKVE